ncbi:MAG: hypothetical protein F4Y74_05575 [Gemmatimonadales bacterium]|nr:hypothetical protein [Gemmatimonadales bacterium]MYG18967.1 hypothetical protein [Gemmatimonadales bacterium]MYH09017.1 hypothetical protein [Gemmatimonadales bacterium]
MRVLLKRFAGRFALTMSLVVLEAVGWILFPLFIGRAIDSVLADSTRGLYEFGALGIATMLIAIVRRLVDSRAYARIYVGLGEEMVGADVESDTSIRTARLGMLREVVEFFENSLPALVNSLIGLGGTVLILWLLNVPVFLGCLLVAVATVTLYALTGRLTTRYNEGFNDQYERQVDAVHSGDPRRLGEHLRAMMRWNIRLSDLEAGTFGLNWVFMTGLLVFAVASAAEQTLEYGAVFAIVMYVFQFVESMLGIPLYYQQWLRLREISGRLAGVGVEAGAAA